jgi:hypothetical protein
MRVLGENMAWLLKRIKDKSKKSKRSGGTIEKVEDIKSKKKKTLFDPDSPTEVAEAARTKVG